ncbi:hypothetical protein Tco_0163965 [Tanacetum coccineum]
MFIKYSTNQIPPKKSRGKGSKGKKTAEESQETVDVSEESEPEPKPAKKKTSGKRRLKKKITLSADDNIISDDPDAALELAKSISQTEAEEAKPARKVHATHARIMTEFVPEIAKKKSSGRSSKSVVIQDTPNAPKSKPATSKTKLKGAPSLTSQEQEAADIMQALKESKKTSRRQPGTRGSNEGTGVLDEDKDVTEEKVILEWGNEQDSEFSDDDNDDVEKDDKDGDADDKGNDHVSDTQDDDDEDVETEFDKDDIYKYKIRVRKDEDVEMKDVEVEESDKGEEKVTNAAKEEAEMTSEAKDDTKKSELPPSSSSLSVSSGFGDQFLKLSSDSSLVSTVKDSTNTDVIAKLEKDVSELKTVDHSSEALDALQSNVPTVVDRSEKSPLDILKIKREQAESQKNTQFTIKSTDKAAIEEYDLKIDLYQSMHANKSFNRNPTNHRLYHALVEALIEDENEMDKGVADTVKDHKRKHDDNEDDDNEDPPAGLNQGKKTKMRRTKESESSKKPSTTKDTTKGKTPTKGSKTACDDNPPQDTSKPKTRNTLNPQWLKQPPRPPTPDPEWNKRQVVLDQPAQPWFNQMVSASKDPLTLNDLMATPIDFSNIELEYNFQECFNALTYKLDWNNPEGDRYPFDLSKPLPLQGPPGHRTVAADYFFNNDLEYLKTSDPEVTYTTSITKTKAARYEIKGIEDMVPILWSTIKHAYDKDASMGIKHWGKRRKLWYGSQVSKFSKQYVYSTKAILGVKSVSVKKLHGYGHLEEILVKIFKQQLYKFKEGDFVDLHLNDIEDMFLLAVQHKLFHLDGSDIVDFIVPLHMFTRNLILKRRVEDLQLGVEKPYTPSYDPPRIVYEDLDKHKRVLRADELYKFSDGTLKSVCDEIHHRVLEFHLDYNSEMPKRKWTAVDRKRLGLMIELIDKQLREREIIRNLEQLVCARELEMDYKLMTRTV